MGLPAGRGEKRRRRSSRAISQKASDTSTKTPARNNAASALTSGLTPRRTLENTAIGRVVADGPVTKLAITRSSSDKVNARSQPETKAGLMPGRVIRASTVQGRAPRSSAASSSVRSKPANWARTNTETKHAPNVACAIVMVMTPRLCGQPIKVSPATNNNSSERPRITSGTTSGAINANPNNRRPRKCVKRAMLNPARVPSTSDKLAAIAATSRLVTAAPRKPSFFASSPYQRVENPAQTVTSRDALNE